ncbi:hypothetical protein M3D01_004190 [Micrococcus luteus]|nr:hypothetical protein [Micrococcus luteus]
MALIHAHAETDSPFDAVIDESGTVSIMRKSDGQIEHVGHVAHHPDGIGITFENNRDIFSFEGLREITNCLELYTRTQRLIDALNNDPQEA